MSFAQNPFAGIESPFFWPFGLALSMDKQILETPEKSRKFFTSIIKITAARFSSEGATPSKIIYDKPAFVLRDFSTSFAANEIPTLIVSPYAGHAGTIADFYGKQSIVERLLQNGLTRVFCIDWRDATQKTKDYDIDDCLAGIHTAVCDMGGRVNLIGLCQGGVLAALYAARYSPHVEALVCAGTAFDTQTENGAIRDLANALPISFYESLIEAGNGVLEGRFMLEGLKGMNPEQHIMNKFLSIYEYIDDPDYRQRNTAFERWYLNMVDVPGHLYLQMIGQLFKKNLFIKGEMTALGQNVKPQSIVCPVYLLAGSADDIAPKDQVFNVAGLLGTPANRVIKDLASSGHMGLFIGTRAIRENWSKIAVWLLRV